MRVITLGSPFFWAIARGMSPQASARIYRRCASIEQQDGTFFVAIFARHIESSDLLGCLTIEVGLCLDQGAVIT